MEIVKKYQEDDYEIIEYENGVIEKFRILENSVEEPEQIEEYISQEEIYQAKVLTDLEYLKCLAEINGGM